MANFAGFEARLNASSEELGLRYEGLTGGWNLLNPVIQLDKLHFPIGTAHEVYFEIDAFESLLRNQLVARRLHVKNVEIFLEHPAAMQGSEFRMTDVLGNAMLLYSDELFVETLGIAIQTHSKSHYYVGSFTSKDMGDHQAFRSDLTSLTCDGCIVHVAVDLERVKYPIVNHLGRVDIDIKDFPIHPEILGVSHLPEATLSVAFHGEKSEEHFDGDGHAEIAFGDEEPNGLHSNVLVSSFGGLTTVELRDTTIQTGTESFTHDPIFIREFANERVVWMEELEIGVLASLLVNILGEESAIGRWVEAMDPLGNLYRPTLLMEEGSVAIDGLLTNVSLNAYQEMPGIKADEVKISGDLWFPRLSVENAAFELHAANHFSESWHFDAVTGTAQFHFGEDRVAMYVEEVDGSIEPLAVISKLGINRALGVRDFTYTNINQSVSGVLRVPASIDLVPNQVPVGAKDWIHNQINSALVSDFNLVHHFIQEKDGLSKQNLIQLVFDFQEGIVEYLPDWPLLWDASGSVYVGPDDMRVDLDGGLVWDTEMKSGVVELPFEEDTFHVSFEVEAEPNQMIQFVLATELRDYFTAVRNTWVGSGSVALDASLELSYGGEVAANNVDLSFDLQRVQLGDTELDLYFDDLTGIINYRTPYVIEGNDIKGSMFGNPLHLDIGTEIRTVDTEERLEHVIQFELAGSADVTDVYAFLAMEENEFTNGGAPFTAQYRVFAEGQQSPELTIESHLEGVGIALGEPLQKKPSTQQPTEVRMVFHDDITEMDFSSGALNGWLDLTDEGVARGLIGIGTVPTPRLPSVSDVRITGSIREWAYQRGSIGASTVTQLVLEDFRVGKLYIRETEITDAVLKGYFKGNEWSLDISSEEVVGHIEQLADQPMRVHIQELNWPNVSADDTDESPFDPLHPSIVPWLSPMHLTLDQVRLVDPEGQHEDYGKWDMKIFPSPDGIMITDLTGEVRGLNIETTNDAFWDTEQNVSQFEVAITGTDLGGVLTAWDYSTQMVSERFELRGNLFWPGSPLAYDLQNLSGSFTATTRDGRFLEIEQNPALRIVSLLNISTIADRLQLDFGDVLLKGYAYEDISLGAIADNGMLRLDDPLRIKGSSTELRMLGSINMQTEELNLEVIATLPLSKALPWYSAAISIANPALGVGLLIGSTTLGGPIRQMTSGRYTVQGTLTDPEVNFVEMFDASFSDSSELQLPATSGETNTGASETEPVESEDVDNPHSSIEENIEPVPSIQSQQADQ